MRKIILIALVGVALVLNMASSVEARNCPRHLACGCRLASSMGIDGKLWRRLWVARNWLEIGRRARHGCVGCIVVLRRGRRGGHVGKVVGYEGRDPIVYSWANARLGWTTATYPARLVLGYRLVNRWSLF